MSGPPEPRRARARKRASRAARALVYLAAVAILLVTLYPTEPMGSGGARICLICGERGLADAILNVILFMPLGGAVAVASGSTRIAIVVGAVLSGGVELAQLTIVPGRDASLGDLVFNTLGAACGVLAVRRSRVWLGENPVVAARLSLAAALLALGVVSATGFLLRMSLPHATYFVMWTPVLSHLDVYDAPVHALTIGGRAFPPSRIEQPARLRELLASGAPVTVNATAASRTARLAAMISIYDDEKREIVLLGQDGVDLVFRYRTRAAALRLDQPDVRARGAFAGVRPGSPVTVSARHHGPRFCLGRGERSSCTHGFSAGMGWALLLYGEQWASWFQKLLGAFWLAALALPVGFWSRRSPLSVAAIVVLALAVTAAPLLAGLVPTPPVELFGAVAGCAVGVGLAWLLSTERQGVDERRTNVAGLQH